MAGVSEGEGPNCLQETKATPEATPPQEATASTQETMPSKETKVAPSVKSKTAKSRRLPSFLRRVDLFLSHRR